MNVTTNKELEAARTNRVSEIVVVGKLADKLHRSRKIAKLSAATLAVLIAALGVAVLAGPETLGFSVYAVGAVAAGMTGIEIAAIIAAVSVGLALVLAVYKEYDEISYESGKLSLRRKSS